MLRDLISKGKEIADKVTNIVMNFTEVETKVREATSDEAWGPHGRLMNELAEYTYCHSTYLEVMGTLWKRLHTENMRNWRRVYKSLILLDFLLKNGSEQVLSGAREHIYDIRTLESFHYHDEYGKDQGINVRIKVQEVINLIQDPEKLREERAKAKSNRHLYTGYGGSDRGGWCSSDDSYYGNRYSDQDYDHYESAPKPSRLEIEKNFKDKYIPRAPVQQPQQSLGDFDEWHVGRERGVVDDVIEQIREAWDVAKLSTKDIFFKKDSDVDVRESNPRMVSEEMYEFPQEAVEVYGTLDSDVNPARSEPRHTTHSRDLSGRQPHRDEDFDSRDVSPIHRRRATTKTSSASKPVEVLEQKQSVESKPQLPLVDLMGSWDDVQTTPIPSVAHVTDPAIDLFELPGDGQQKCGLREPTGASEQQWPSSKPVTTNIVAAVSDNGKNFSDNEFGEFLTAHQTTPVPVNPTTNLVNLTDFSSPASIPVGMSNAASVSFLTPNKTTSLWLDSQNGSVIGASIPISPPAGNLINNASKPAVTSSPSAHATTDATQASTPVQIGSTWKELDALGINLDKLTQPDRMNQRSAPGPSLRELQQTHHKLSSLTSMTTATARPGKSTMIVSPLSSPMHITPMTSVAAFQQNPLNPTPRPAAAQPALQNPVDFSLI